MTTCKFLTVTLLSIFLSVSCGDLTKASIAARGNGASQLAVPAETAASPSDVCIGKSFIGASKEVLQGTKDCTAAPGAPTECSADVNTNCIANDAFPAVDVTKLVATNIKSGVTIAGVVGSVVGSAYSICGTNGAQECIVTGTYFAATTCAINGSNCFLPSYALGVQNKKAIDFSTIDNTKMLDTLTIAGVGGTVTLPSAGDVRLASTYGPANVLSGTLDPAAGVPANCSWDGQQDCVVPSPNWAAAAASTANQNKILTGQSVGGNSGTLILPNASNVLSGSGQYGMIGSLLTPSLANRGSWDLTLTFPGAGYYSGVSNAPSAAVIKEQNTVLGVAGTLGFPDFFGSGIHHTKTTPGGWTMRQELDSGLSLASVFATGRHEIPRIGANANADGSNDGYGAGNLTVTKASRPTVICGKSASTIALKIANCASNNPTTYTWNGAVNGNGGEGSWTLVSAYPIDSGAFNDAATCASAGGCREVWRDDRTQLLWSDRLHNPGPAIFNSTASTFNWCSASGSNNKAAVNPYAELDPSASCGNGTNTDTSHQYGDSQLPVSLCAEDATYLQTPTFADDEKGGLLAGSIPAVHWRLSTIYDWNVANFNGVRHVLPNMADSFWSSSVTSNNRDNAWVFYGTNGWATHNNRFNPYAVRCVARP